MTILKSNSRILIIKPFVQSLSYFGTYLLIFLVKGLLTNGIQNFKVQDAFYFLVVYVLASYAMWILSPLFSQQKVSIRHHKLTRALIYYLLLSISTFIVFVLTEMGMLSIIESLFFGLAFAIPALLFELIKRRLVSMKGRM